MDRLADERVPRDDRAIGTQPIAALPALAQVAAVRVGEALTRPVEIQPAHLEAATDLPDAVERPAMALVG